MEWQSVTATLAPRPLKENSLKNTTKAIGDLNISTRTTSESMRLRGQESTCAWMDSMEPSSSMSLGDLSAGLETIMLASHSLDCHQEKKAYMEGSYTSASCNPIVVSDFILKSLLWGTDN